MSDPYQEAFNDVLAQEPKAWKAERIRIKRRKYCYAGTVTGRFTFAPGELARAIQAHARPYGQNITLRARTHKP